MPKRKRLRSNSGVSDASPNKIQTRNDPFGKLVPAASTPTSERDSDDLLPKLLSFVKLSKGKKDGDSKTKMRKVAEDLLGRLPKTGDGPATDSPSHGLVSHIDIINAVLPWAIKIIINKRDDQTETELEWTAVSKCIDVLLGEDSNSRNMASVTSSSGPLSTSTLHKLVPLAQSAALNGHENIRAMAGSTYCHILNQWYKPNFDIVCDGLLSRLKSPEVESLRGDDLDESLMEVVSTTLVLLKRTMKKANPKKAFQTLITPKVLVPLSRLSASFQSTRTQEETHPCNLVHHIIKEGIFSLEHHMDGFRSLQLSLPDLRAAFASRAIMDVDETKEKETSRASMHTYHKDLCDTIDNEFQRVSTQQTPSEKDFALAPAIPLLLECLFLQTSTLLKDSKFTGNKKKNLSKKVGQLQFLMFANLSGSLVRAVRTVDKDNVGIAGSALIKPLHHCVQLLLEHDVYLPSNEDANGRHFYHLKELASILVSLETDSISTTAFSFLPTLGALLQLNHLTLHDRLETVIAFCCTRTNEGSIPQDEVCQFLQTMLSTYQRLRQLDHLCHAAMAAVLRLVTNQQHSRVRSLHDLLEDGSVAKAFCEAVQGSPMQQAKMVLSDLNKWIQAMSSEVDSDERTIAEGIATGVLLLSYFLKSIRTDVSSVHDLCERAQGILDGSVTNLIGCTTDFASIGRRGVHGLRLCSWTLSLQTRCDFWARNDARRQIDSDLPESVKSILASAVALFDGRESAVTARDAESRVIDELQLLACYSLRRLHARTQEEQKVTLSLPDHAFVSNDIMTARQLASFVLRTLRTEEVDVGKFRDRWLLLADSIGLWVPYVEAADLSVFMTYFWSSVAANHCEATREVDETDRSKEMSILQDATFFENNQVLSELGSSSAIFTASCVLKAVTGEKYDGLSQLMELHEEATSSKWSALSSSDLSRILSGMSETKQTKGRICLDSDALQFLEAGYAALSTINSLPISTWSICDDLANTVETLIRLDFLCMEALSNKLVSDILGKTMAVARAVLGRILMEKSEQSMDPGLLQQIYLYLLNSCNELSKKDTVGETLSAVLDSTKALSELLASDTTVQYHDVATTFVDMYGDDEKFNKENLCVLSVFGCSIIASSHKLGDSHKVLRKRIGKVFASSRLQNQLLDGAFRGTKTSKRLQKYCIELLAILYRKCETLDSEDLKTSLDLIEEPVASKLSTKLLSTNIEARVTYLYLLLCFVSRATSVATRNQLFSDMLHECPIQDQMIEVALWELASQMDSEEFESALRLAASTAQKRRNSSLILRLLRLMVLNANNPDHLNALSRYARQFLSIALHALEDTSNPDIASHATNLIMELASRRDVLHFRERDICLVLTSMVVVLRVPTSDVTTRLKTVHKESFDACFSVFAFLLQRFSKQMFYCIPSVIGALNLLLLHTLYDDVDSLEAMDRGNKFSRICELLLPYKDIYKKHVLCIVMQFVIALKNNLDPMKRESLAPAMHCLLDMLQQHETLQLNAMLDDVGRAMLKTVNEGYKKLYAYKGQ